MDVSNWVWITGGVIAGLVVFSLAYQQIVQVNLARTEQRSLEGYSEMKSIVDNLCWSFVGNKREYTLSIGETIEGIYVASSQYEEYGSKELLNKILAKEESTGKFLCIKIKDKRLKCQELECDTNMPFFGSVPEEYSLIAFLNKLMGKGMVFTYRLLFERNETGVKVELYPVIELTITATTE